RSTRPYERAAATAAPSPTATVQPTEPASAPGTAPHGRSHWLYRTSCSCPGRWAPTPPVYSISTCNGGHGPAGRLVLPAAQLPAPSVTQPSATQVGRLADRTDNEPIEPPSASRHRCGVRCGSTSSRRRPAAPATITRLAAGSALVSRGNTIRLVTATATAAATAAAGQSRPSTPRTVNRAHHHRSVHC